MAVAASAPFHPSAWLRGLRALPEPARVGVAALLGLVLGGLTSPAQGILPAWIEPAANSASGWTLAVVLVVLLLRPRPGWAALDGPVCFAALTLGYQVVSTWRGYPTNEVCFLVAGLVVGPFIGVAAAWLRFRGPRAALAAALLGGIGLGEGWYGLTAVLATTGPVWWILVAAAGAALVAVVTARRTRGWLRLVPPAGALAVAAAFVAAFGAA